jgi:hypothetical protein
MLAVQFKAVSGWAVELSKLLCWLMMDDRKAHVLQLEHHECQQCLPATPK